MRAEKIIQRTFHTMPSLLQNMSINHCGGDIVMAEKRLDGSDVYIALQEMSRETVPEGMSAYSFFKSNFLHCRFDGFIDGTRVNMMALFFVTPGIN